MNKLAKVIIKAMNKKASYVAELKDSVQNILRKEINRYLKSQGYKGQELEQYVNDAMNSKIEDLEELKKDKKIKDILENI